MAEYINRASLINNLITFAPEHYTSLLNDLILKEPAADVVERKSCNTCQYYDGVHNVAGNAPCSFWNIGAVMWNDFCLRWKGENDG